MSADFRTNEVSLRVQKKLASQFSNKTVAKAVLDEDTSKLLDHVYRLCKSVCGDKKRSEKVMKNIIKIVVKINILLRNDKFSDEEMANLAKFQKTFNMTVMSVVSFIRIKFTYDRSYLLPRLQQMRDILLEIVDCHLSDKSKDRVNNVFEFFTVNEHLDQIFNSNAPHAQLVANIADALDVLMQSGATKTTDSDL